jgi:hypothetical protein
MSCCPRRRSCRLSTEPVLELSWPEAVGVFLLLKRQETALEVPMRRLLARLERVLYERLSIEEFEQLRRGGEKKV